MKNFDGNFTQKAIVRTYGCENDGTNTNMVMGRTIIPFGWLAEYNIIVKCKSGSFLYAINITQNTTHYLSANNGGICGLNANAGDIIVFFGMVEFL